MSIDTHVRLVKKFWTPSVFLLWGVSGTKQLKTWGDSPAEVNEWSEEHVHSV